MLHCVPWVDPLEDVWRCCLWISFFAKKCNWSEQSKVINVIFTCLASQQSQIGAPTWLFVGYIFPFSFEERKHNNHDWRFRSSCNGDYPQRNSSYQLIQWNNRMDESSIVGRYEVGARMKKKKKKSSTETIVGWQRLKRRRVLALANFMNYDHHPTTSLWIICWTIKNKHQDSQRFWFFIDQQLLVISLFSWSSPLGTDFMSPSYHELFVASFESNDLELLYSSPVSHKKNEFSRLNNFLLIHKGDLWPTLMLSIVYLHWF